MAGTLSIPFTVGGGVASVEGIFRLLRAGADKVALNTAAIADPPLVSQAAAAFGRQCVVVAVDVARDPALGWRVFAKGGKVPTELRRRRLAAPSWRTWARARSCSPPSTGTAPSRASTWTSWTWPRASPSR